MTDTTQAAAASSGAAVTVGRYIANRDFNYSQRDEALDNIRHSLTLNLEQLPVRMTPRRAPLIICGGGPSIADNLDELRAWAAKPGAKVIALNNTVEFLMERDIPVWGTVFMEVADWEPNFMNPPPEGIVYFLCSECAPISYERTKGRKVIQWHAQEDIGEADLIWEKYPEGVPLVPGGGSASTRSIYLGHAMGYRTFVFFGIDSSHTDQSHAYEHRPDPTTRSVLAAGEWFTTPSYLLRQADDFIEVLKSFINEWNRRPAYRSRFIFYGDGLVPHIARQYGFHADQQSTRKAA